MTNLELLTMRSTPQHRPTPVMERLGRIRFSMETWEGHDGSGVDFPFIFAQLGFVPVDVQTDIRTRIVTVTYRWFGFPRMTEALGEAVQEYRVTVGWCEVAEDGVSRREVVRLILMPVNNAAVSAQLVALRKADCWIVNPSSVDLEDEGEEVIHTTPVGQGPRSMVRTRRIVVRG